jgi:catechol 2,3-dioxygenase-like lactoylglutathione lyase family enzyme
VTTGDHPPQPGAASATGARAAAAVPDSPVRELRVAVTVDDYDAAVRFYRDALGLPVIESWDQPHDRRGVILAAGQATLELLSTAQTALVDQVETDPLPEAGDPEQAREPEQAGAPSRVTGSGQDAGPGRAATGPPVRLAIEVEDSAAAAEALVAGGAEQLGGPVVTPWQHRNVRLRAPDGMQLTLFTVLDPDQAEGSSTPENPGT